jgi:hypothetical protein
MNKPLELKVVFMIRHINDLDFSLPIILNACNPIVIFYEPVDKSDKRVQIILNEIRYFFFYKKNYLYSFYIFLQKIIRFFFKFIGKPSLVAKINTHISDIEIALSLKNLKKILKIISSEHIYAFIFDHTATLKVLKKISFIKSNFDGKINIFSIPHGTNIFKNKMLDKHNLSPPSLEVGYENYSLVICGDNQQLENHNGNKKFIENLRYTDFWVKKLISFYEIKKIVYDDLKLNKIKVLILHSKAIGNINIDEVRRCLKILEKFNNLDVRIKPHPRGMDEVQLISKASSRVEITKLTALECIDWADCVIFFQTSSVYDAFLLKKPVIFPSYVTANKLVDEILNNCNIAETPDDFYLLVRKLSNNGDLMLPNFCAPSWDEALAKWRILLKY